MKNGKKLNSDIEFIRHLKKFGGDTMKKCFQCATCSVVCSLSPIENSFPRKEMIKAGWGLKQELIHDPDIWLCHGCMDCSQMCPRGARPADLMGAIRSYIYRFYSTPSFMGKALSEPKYLPYLLILPIILIFILMLVTQGGDLSAIDWSIHQFKYKDFIAHGPIEALFISGNILVFTLAYLGFKRYWDDLHKYNDYKKVQNFIPSLIQVAKEFMLHKKFDKCPTNSARYYGHLFIFYGFVGALIATAIVVANLFGAKLGLFPEFLPEHMNMPLYLLGGVNFEDPNEVTEFVGLIVKSFGLLAGTLMVIGGLILLIKRQVTEEREGKSTYYDMLFLWVIWGVAFTGMCCVFLRLLQVPVVAYPTYFVHLVLVYFLLWYMPYSKFAHMIYRFLGLTYLKMYGRDAKIELFEKKYNKNKVTEKVTV